MPSPDKTYRYAIQDGNLEGKPSVNGIIVNGRSTKKYILEDGDEIVIGGKATLIYRTPILSDQELEEKVTHPEFRRLKGNVVGDIQTIQVEDMPTKLQSANPPNSIKKEINSFRQCYEFVLQELRDLNLEKSDYITIASAIYQKIKE